MKIISKFKDYYDSGAVYGIDETRLYVRDNQIIETKEFHCNAMHFNILGFCGKLYPFISESSRTGFGSDWVRHPKDWTLYGDDVYNKTFVNEKGDESRYVHGFTNWDKITIKDRKEISRYGGVYNIKRVKDDYDKISNNKTLRDLFLKYKTPIFILWKERVENQRGFNYLEINPKLEDIAFYKIKSTVETFQEIEMYISNVLVNDTEVMIPTGNDIVIANSKGFDKWSFRKEKQTK